MVSGDNPEGLVAEEIIQGRDQKGGIVMKSSDSWIAKSLGLEVGKVSVSRPQKTPVVPKPSESKVALLAQNSAYLMALVMPMIQVGFRCFSHFSLRRVSRTALRMASARVVRQWSASFTRSWRSWSLSLTTIEFFFGSIVSTSTITQLYVRCQAENQLQGAFL